MVKRPGGHRLMGKPAKVVLLVDGEISRAERLAQRLQRCPYQVEVVHNGAAGLLRAHETIPDVIVAACELPILDGCRMLDALRSKNSTAHIPIILIAYEARPDEMARAWNSGADLCIPGGPGESDLWATLHRALETSFPALAAAPAAPLSVCTAAC